MAHIELAPKQGERSQTIGDETIAIRSNFAWRELASKALYERDIAVNSLADAQHSLDLRDSRLATIFSALTLNESESAALSGSPLFAARLCHQRLTAYAARGDAADLSSLIGAIVQLEHDACAQADQARKAIAECHAARAALAEREKAEGAANRRAQNADETLADMVAERKAIGLLIGDMLYDIGRLPFVASREHNAAHSLLTAFCGPAGARLKAYAESVA